MAGYPIGSPELREHIHAKVEAMTTPAQRTVEQRWGIFMPPELAKQMVDELLAPHDEGCEHGQTASP